MGQEYFINSSALQDKVASLLPSQGGAGAGFDLSASTQIIPVINLTESAEGSNIREDLQTSLSHKSITTFNVTNTTTTFLNFTGYWRIFGAMSTLDSTNAGTVTMSISDGATDKILLDGKSIAINTLVGVFPLYPFDFNVFIPAGGSVKATSSSTLFRIVGNFRQIADIDGNLTNP